jgi:hypothetical protein
MCAKQHIPSFKKEEVIMSKKNERPLDQVERFVQIAVCVIVAVLIALSVWGFWHKHQVERMARPITEAK